MKQIPKVPNHLVPEALASLGRTQKPFQGEETNPAEDIALPPPDEHPRPSWRNSCEAYIDLAFHGSNLTSRMLIGYYADESLRGMARPFEHGYYSLLEDVEELLDTAPDLSGSDLVRALTYIHDDNRRSWTDMIELHPSIDDEHSRAWHTAYDLGYETGIAILHEYLDTHPLSPDHENLVSVTSNQ